MKQEQRRQARPSPGKAIESVAQGCTDCGLCRDECGFLEKYGTPKQIADRYDAEAGEMQSLPFECSLCRLCEAVCPLGVKPAAMFLEMRRAAVDRGTGPFPEHGGLLAYEKKGMSRRFTWYGIPTGCRTVLFPGCAMPGTRPARTRELFEVLRKEEPSMGIVLDCCGKISHDLGREVFFNAMLDEMTDYLRAKGVEEVLTVCPNCHDMFSRYGKGLRARMVYEALPGDSPARIFKGKKAVVHDPCGVRFDTGAHAAVRRLIGLTGIAAEEIGHGRERTFCCGNGAGVSVLSPELADRWKERTWAETGEKPIITYCCACAGRLGSNSPAVHALDFLAEPDTALAGKSRVSTAPFTYLNRLRLKKYFKKAVNASSTRERIFHPPEEKGKGWAARLGLLAVLVTAIIAVRATGSARYLDQETLRHLIAGHGFLAPLIYMLIYSLAPALLLPGLPITIAGGILFGPFWGVVYTIIGSTAGACTAFLISRYVARGWVEEKLRSPRWRRLDESVEKNGWKVVAFTRLIPLFPFNLLNYAFGMTKIGFLPYAATTFICMLPACIAFIVFSSSLLDLVRGKVSPSLLIGIALIVLVSLIPIFYRRYTKRKGLEDPL